MKSVLFTSVLVSLVLLLGRLSGFVRETLLAATFGPTKTADAAIVILTLPDFMVGLLLAGGLNAALIPLLKQSEGAARVVLVQKAAMLFGGAFIVLAGVMAIWPSVVTGLLAPALDVAGLPDYLTAFRISLIGLPVVAVVGIAAGYLNTIGRFAVPNLSVFLYNIVVCTYLIGAYQAGAGLAGFALAVVAAMLARLALQVFFMGPVLRPAGPMPEGIVQPRLTRDLLGRFGFGVLGFSLIIGAPIVFRALFAKEGDGNLALFNFSQKLFELPAALMIAPVVIVMLPKLAGLSHKGADQAAFYQTARVAVTAGFTLALTATAIAAVFVIPIAQAVFLYGEMSITDVSQIADMTLVFMLSLPMLAVLQLCAAGLNARGQPGTVLVWAAVGLVLALLVTWGLSYANLPPSLPPAAIGYAVFHLLSGVFYLGALFGWHRPTRVALVAIATVLGRTVMGILPFVGIMAFWADDLGRWGGLALTLPALAVLLWLNQSALRPLLHMRIDDA
jgi:peptidoglycan biosynthesis protein MviN/MurJ (putative lipid II flippase)